MKSTEPAWYLLPPRGGSEVTFPLKPHFAADPSVQGKLAYMFGLKLLKGPSVGVLAFHVAGTSDGRPNVGNGAIPASNALSLLRLNCTGSSKPRVPR